MREEDAVDLELAVASATSTMPGLFNGSKPNHSSNRRCGYTCAHAGEREAHA